MFELILKISVVQNTEVPIIESKSQRLYVLYDVADVVQNTKDTIIETNHNYTVFISGYKVQNTKDTNN